MIARPRCRSADGGKMQACRHGSRGGQPIKLATVNCTAHELAYTTVFSTGSRSCKSSIENK